MSKPAGAASSSSTPVKQECSFPGKAAYVIWRTNFLIDDKYVPIKAIGKGAYGVVCSADNRATGARLAGHTQPRPVPAAWRGVARRCMQDPASFVHGRCVSITGWATGACREARDGCRCPCRSRPPAQPAARSPACSAMRPLSAGEKVAIKKIGQAFAHVQDARRTLREVKLLRHLTHPNVMAIRDIMPPASLTDFEDLYVVSELMDTDLHQIIRSAQALTDEHFQFFIYQVRAGRAARCLLGGEAQRVEGSGIWWSRAGRAGWSSTCPVWPLPDVRTGPAGAVRAEVHPQRQRHPQGPQTLQPARQRGLRAEDLRLWPGQDGVRAPPELHRLLHAPACPVRTVAAQPCPGPQRGRWPAVTGHSCTAAVTGKAPCRDTDFMTEYVVTRWYRAPELLLSCEKYDAGPLCACRPKTVQLWCSRRQAAALAPARLLICCSPPAMVRVHGGAAGRAGSPELRAITAVAQPGTALLT